MAFALVVCWRLWRCYGVCFRRLVVGLKALSECSEWLYTIVCIGRLYVVTLIQQPWTGLLHAQPMLVLLYKRMRGKNI